MLAMKHLRLLCSTLALVLPLVLSLMVPVVVSAQAAAPATAAAPADQKTAPAAMAATATATAPAAAIAEPKAGETNAQRNKTQPGNNAPFWRGVRDSGSEPGVSSLPGAEKGQLIQPFVQYPGSRLASAGEAWRQVRNQWIIPYGGALIVIVALAIGIFYWRKGPMGEAGAADAAVVASGRTIERFTPFERSAHWLNAITFCVLAVSGLVMAFGKFFLLPVLGSTLFGWLTYALKTMHNFAGPVFAVSLLVVIVTFIRDNLPRAGDLQWLAKGGGMLGGEHVPSHRFNAGEKVIFWAGVFFFGLIVVASGLVLDKLVPGLGDTRGQMQVAHMVHAVATIFMMVLFCGHIYLGTVGMKGAYSAMRTGHVDDAWAKEHHVLWHDDIKAGKIPAHRSQETDAGVGAAAPQG